MEEVKSWKTTDGQVFTDLAEAEVHETGITRAAEVEAFVAEFSKTAPKYHPRQVKLILAWITYQDKKAAAAAKKS